MSIGNQDMPSPSWPFEPPRNLKRGTATSQTPFAPHWQRDTHPGYTTKRP